MGLFNLFKKQELPVQPPVNFGDSPYQDDAANFIYNLLFCDNPGLYTVDAQGPLIYPFDILFSDTSTVADLQKLIDDPSADARVKLLAYNRQRAIGHSPVKKELLAVIVEVGLDVGLDVLASFLDGTARYINQTGKILVWENTTDQTVNGLTADLFGEGRKIIEQIGPWDQPRRPHPAKGYSRISFLVSDGLYFGEAPTNALFNDPLARNALTNAAHLIQYLTEMAVKKKD